MTEKRELITKPGQTPIKKVNAPCLAGYERCLLLIVKLKQSGEVWF